MAMARMELRVGGIATALVPAVVIFVIFQREFIESNLGSAVKG